jgi:hypothetical protein
VFSALDIDDPSIPASFPERLIAVAGMDLISDCNIFCNILIETIDVIVSANYETFRLTSLSIFPDQLDERCNAMIGSALSFLSSTKTILAKSDILAYDIAEATLRWSPLSKVKPSTMEYLIAIGVLNWPQLNSIGKPLCTTPDTMALNGFLLSRIKQYDEAVKVISRSIDVVLSQYTVTSMEFGITVAELSSCYNILRQEDLAENWARMALDAPESAERLDGPLRFYLTLAVVDSLIGRARYNEAALLLQEVTNGTTASETVLMMSALRLAKTRRRLHEEAHRAFEQSSPLWIGVAVLDQVPDNLRKEYIEELACNLSSLSDTALEQSRKPRELIHIVNSILQQQGTPTNSPSLEWYTSIQQKYLERSTEEITLPAPDPLGELQHSLITPPENNLRDTNAGRPTENNNSGRMLNVLYLGKSLSSQLSITY